MLFRRKSGMDTWHNMVSLESIKWRKPDTKGGILYGFLGLGMAAG